MNPHNNLNFVEILRSPWLCFSESDLNHLAYQSQKQSLWNTLLSSTDKRFKNIQSELKNLLKDSDEIGVAETMKKVCIYVGMIDLCRVYDPYGDLEAHIWKYFSQLQSAQQKPDFHYLQFAQDILEASDLESYEPSSIESHRLQLMTVHKSKGLEFEHVVIPYLKKIPPKSTTKELFLVSEDQGFWGIPLKNAEGQKKHSLL